MKRVWKYAPFCEVFGGQRFVDMTTNNLCRKLHDEYVLHAAAFGVPPDGDRCGGHFLPKEVVREYTYNAIVESTGKLVYIDPEKPVQLIF